MASLKLEHVYKVYPNGTKAVNDLVLDIKDGEFIVFVGPSGCGKSTTLRMIAGLEDITAGELYIGDTLVNDVEPKDRDIAMVFQNYALYPHMTVYENMAFGLTLRHIPRNVIHEKVMWAADILGLKDYLDRKPRQMSGGQRQRVALGRAILRDPKVMLLDEPLSNLDAKLRSQMRSEISKLHLKLKTTFVYVTHDQVEAMTLGTRVVVMRLGDIQQVDTPKNLYDYPINKFVAGFIGTPQMNFYNVTLLEDADRVRIRFKDSDQDDLVIPYSRMSKAKKKYLDGKTDVILGVRCEAVSVEDEDVRKGDNLINVVVSHFEELGNETLIYGDLNNVSTLGESKTGIIIKASSSHGYKAGDVIKARVKVSEAHFFDAESEKTIIPRIPNVNVFPVRIKDGKILFAGGSFPLPAAIELKELEGEMEVPLDAISLNDDGDLTAVIDGIEDVDGTLLAYLKRGEHRFFAIVPQGLAKDESVRLLIDWEKVRFFDEEAKVVAEPLARKDAILSSFVNFKTMEAKVHDEAYINMRNARIKAVEDKHVMDLAAIERKYAPLKAAPLSKEESREKLRKAKEKLLGVKLAEKAKLNAARAEKSKSLAEARAKHNARIAEIKKATNKEYADLLAKEVADYQEAVRTNKDRDAIRARKASLNIFRDSLPALKQNDLNNRINAASFDYDTERNGYLARYELARFNVEKAVKDAAKAYRLEVAPEKARAEEKEIALRELKKAYAEDRLHAELLFFFDHDGYYQLIPELILNKIIQGLGTKVFTKGFRIMIPHDAYWLGKNAGIKATVKERTDYLSRSFYRTEAMMYGEPVTLYVETPEKLEKGQEIFLIPDLMKTEIYETGMNIRLY